MEKTTATPQTDSKSETDSLAQIRDIIVGEYSKTWEKRFTRLQEQIQQMNQQIQKQLHELSEKIAQSANERESSHQTLTENLDKTRSEITEMVKAAQSTLQKELTRLKEVKVDKDSIGEVFIQWGQQVKEQKRS